MKDWETGCVVETGSDQVVVIADAHHIRIRIVGIKDGISVRADEIVRNPNLRGGCLRSSRGSKQEDRKDEAEYAAHGSRIPSCWASDARACLFANRVSGQTNQDRSTRKLEIWPFNLASRLEKKD